MLTDNIATDRQAGFLVGLLRHEYAEDLMKNAKEGTTFTQMTIEAERLIKIICQNIGTKEASDLISISLKDGKVKGFEAFCELKKSLIIK